MGALIDCRADDWPKSQTVDETAPDGDLAPLRFEICRASGWRHEPLLWSYPVCSSSIGVIGMCVVVSKS